MLWRWQNSMRSKMCGIHEGLAQADQHHVFGGVAGFAHQALEDLVRHVGFGLLVGFARAHGAIEIAFGGGLHDVFHRQRRQPWTGAQGNPKEVWRGSMPSC